MQIRVFSVPIIGGEAILEEMNVFLRSKKVLRINEHLINHAQEGVFWCYSIRYVEDINTSDREKGKLDYKEVLDEPSFQRFKALKEIRRRVSQEDFVPAYAVFTDGELAEMAKEVSINAENIKKIKGIGEKKTEKYGHHFFTKTADEKSK